MSKFDGVWIFLMGIPIVLMAWDTMSNPYGYYMSVEANQLFNVKYLIYNVFTIEQLKELQVDVEEAIVNKE